MANEEHVNILKEGVEHFNTWRCGGEPTIRSLTKEECQEVDLEGADLPLSNLTGIIFRWANLKNICLVHSNLESADLQQADLQEAQLFFADLSNANCSGANLQDADLSCAILEGAKLDGAFMEGADLKDANFTNAELYHADFRNVCTKNTNFEGADLRFTNNLILDSSFIKNAHFDPQARDPWSILRRTYSGTRLVFNMLLLVAFLIPYFAKVLFWAAFNQSQVIYQKRDLEGIAMSEQMLDSLNTSSPCLAAKCDSIPVWKLMLGFDEGWLFVIFVGTLIIYNVFKAGLTYVTTAMRDEEERSGYSPAWEHTHWWQSYRFIYCTHKYVVQVLFYFAFCAFAFNAWYWLTKTVWIPS